MKVLLTGASGFLGNYLSNSLSNYDLQTLGRSGNSSIQFDLTVGIVSLDHYDLVVHCAGKAHSIPNSKKEENIFFKVNFEGTKNLLESLEPAPPSKFVFISTVAVYGDSNVNVCDESSPLDGSSPYAISKIEAENAIRLWCKENHVEYLILRLPLICGNNPPGNLKAMANAINRGYYFRIGKGDAMKSMVGAKDVVGLVAKNNWKQGTYNLTDGLHPSIKHTDELMSKIFDKKIKTLPMSIAKTLSFFGDVFPFFPFNSSRLKKLTSSLVFSDEKAKNELDWNPKSALEQLTFYSNE